MNLPNLKHLQYLLALYKYQHFHRAAEACFVSQSTLSSAIFKLEEQLDCQLIERNHKTFVFTSHGKVIVELAQQLVVSASEMVDYAKQQGSSKAGSIRIGCIPTIAPFLLTDLVNTCKQELPELALYLREDTTENLMYQLAQGEIDTVILAVPVPEHSFQSRVLGRDDFYIAGDKHGVSDSLKAPIVGNGNINNNESKHEKLSTGFSESINYQALPEKSIFLLANEHCLTQHVLSKCKLADKNLINPFSASSLATLVQMTSYHKGITFLPEMAVKKGLGEREGLVIEKLSSDLFREIAMLWRPTSMRKMSFMKIADIIEKLLLD